jgi:hypothetical protein
MYVTVVAASTERDSMAAEATLQHMESMKHPRRQYWLDNAGGAAGVSPSLL